MPEPQAYTFDKAATQRIARAVKTVESAAANTDPSDLAAGRSVQQCILAVLSSRDGTDKGKYAWQQVRRSGTGWDSSGLSGTTADKPAFCPPADPSDTDAQDLSGQHVVLVRGTWKDGSDWKPCWYIAGYAFLPSLGAKKYQVWQMNTD